MEDLDFLLENDDILNELYVGETPFIKKLLDEVSKARAPYVGKHKKPINGNKDFIKIGDMIAKEFGFHAVTFSVPFDTSMNAFTYPITMAMDKSVTGTKPKFFKDHGLKYDESTSKLCILVAVTAGVWFNEKITDREVVAAILHEIGHSFVLQSERLVDVVEANRVAIVIGTIYRLFFKMIFVIQDPRLLVTLPSDIKNIMKSSNKGKEIINKLERELADHPLFAGMKSIKEYIGTKLMNILKEMLGLITTVANIISIPFAALNKLFYSSSQQDYAIGRSQEYLSDSFATMYGFGPEISSFLLKITYDNGSSGLALDKLTSSIPVIGALKETLNIPVYLLSVGMTTHPSTPARITKILEELNNELKNSDLDPKTKEAVKKNIADMERIKAECMAPVEKKKLDAEMVKRMWISFLMGKGDPVNDYETYYTDLEVRDKYVRENLDLLIGDSDLLEACELIELLYE